MIIDFNRYNGGGSSSAVTPEQVQQQIDSALTPYWDSAITESAITEAVSGLATEQYVQDALSGVSLEGYWNSAQTEDAISAATSGKADKKVLVDFDHTSQSERAALYATLKGIYDGGSGATINKNYDFYKTVNTWQGLKIDYYGFSGDTMVFGKVVSPENTADQVVYEQVMTIDSAGNVNVVTNTVGGGDMSGYWNSAETKDYVDGRIDGYDSAVTLQSTNVYDTLLRIGGSVNCSEGDVNFMALGTTNLAITNVAPYELRDLPYEPGLGTINYIKINNLYEVDADGFRTGVYYGFQNSGVFVEGVPVQLVRSTDVEPLTYYTTPQGNGCFIIDVDNLTITWKTQPVVSVHIDGVYDAIDVLDADIQELSARTIPDMSLYTPTSGFSTINGSAITNGGNIVIQGGGGDMSGYWTSAQTRNYVNSTVGDVQNQIDTMDEVAAAAIVDLNNRVLDSVTISNFNNWVGDEVGSILVNAGVATSSGRTYTPVAVAAQSDVQDAVHSNDIRHIVKCTQAEYDDPSFIWDPETLYIIVNNSN